PVDEPGGQGLLLRGPAFALEEAAGNLARRVGLLDVVDGQREPVLSGLRFLGGDHGGEHYGVVHAAHHRAMRLAGDLAGLERDLMCTEAEGFLDGSQRVLCLVPETKNAHPCERPVYYGIGKTTCVDPASRSVRGICPRPCASGNREACG